MCRTRIRCLLLLMDNNEMLGRQAALCLLDAIAGHPHHGVERVPVKLIQRESTLPLD